MCVKKLFTLLLVLFVSITSLKGLQTINQMEDNSNKTEFFLDFDEDEDPFGSSTGA